MICITTKQKDCMDIGLKDCVNINPDNNYVDTGQLIPMLIFNRRDDSENPPFTIEYRWLKVLVEGIKKEDIEITCTAKYIYRPCDANYCNVDHCGYKDDLNSTPYECDPNTLIFREPSANIYNSTGSACYDEPRYYISGTYLNLPITIRSHSFYPRADFYDENGDVACDCRPSEFSTIEIDIDAGSDFYLDRYVNGLSMSNYEEYLRKDNGIIFGHFGYYASYWAKYNNPNDDTCSNLCSVARGFLGQNMVDISGKSAIVFGSDYKIKFI